MILVVLLLGEQVPSALEVYNLKEQSRPFVYNVTSADIRLTTPLTSATSLVNVMKSV